MTITASMVKELRDMTGAGMMDCKTALNETGGDIEAAVDWLRAKGISKADKKAGRTAAEGLIGIAAAGTSAVVVEVNSETDFVARNEKFQEMVRSVARLALKAGGSLDKLNAMETAPGKPTVADHLKELIATIGENMTLRRTAALSVKDGVVAQYVHNAIAPGLGKIGVLVALESTGKTDVLAGLGRQLAMHIAAANPLAVTEADLDPAAIERERAVYLEQARQSGKSEEIIAKMVEGRLKKEFFQQSVLLSQVFVIDGKETVGNVLKASEKDVGAPIKVAGFLRYALGEGIEREEKDFAAEVAAMTKGG